MNLFNPLVHMPSHLELEAGAPVVMFDQGAGVVVEVKPHRYGWPQDGYARVWSEEEGMLALQPGDMRLDIRKPAGFALGLRIATARGQAPNDGLVRRWAHSSTVLEDLHTLASLLEPAAAPTPEFVGQCDCCGCAVPESEALGDLDKDEWLCDDCHVTPHPQFDVMWTMLAMSGKVDTFGGPEYRGVLDRWFAYGRPVGMEAFILEHRG